MVKKFAAAEAPRKGGPGFCIFSANTELRFENHKCGSCVARMRQRKMDGSDLKLVHEVRGPAVQH
jgi:hypothetical protein